jgi:recombination protein RecR
MNGYPDALQDMINQIKKLPGIGARTAQRLAFFILSMENSDVEAFASSLVKAKKTLGRCEQCGNLTDEPVCTFCSSTKRDGSTICVVENPRDLLAIEATGEYKGKYHVLHGVISPIDDLGPDDINLKSLISRLYDKEIEELILATSTTIEGEATAMYISRLVENTGIRVTRIAHGVPMGGELEYADQSTLSRALKGRREI